MSTYYTIEAVIIIDDIIVQRDRLSLVFETAEDAIAFMREEYPDLSFDVFDASGLLVYRD